MNYIEIILFDNFSVKYLINFKVFIFIHTNINFELTNFKLTILFALNFTKD